MENMSGDEVVVLIACAFVALIGWIGWYFGNATVLAFAQKRSSRFPASVAPILGMVVLFWILRKFASADVKNSMTYLTFYMFFGAAWLWLWLKSAVMWTGISMQEDVREHDNIAANYALGGTAVGITLCFAGANIGDGPGWWVVLFCAVLSTAALALLWALIAAFTGVADHITIDRDDAAGFRMGGFATAAGLILGRSVAGDWTSAAAAVTDFLKNGASVLLLFAMAIAFNLMSPPSRERPSGSVFFQGVIPSVFYVLFAAGYVYYIGSWK